MKIKFWFSCIFLLFLLSCENENNTQTQIKTQKHTQENILNIQSTATMKTVITRVWVDEFEKTINNPEYSILDLRTTWELHESGIIGNAIMQIDVYDDPQALEKIKKLDRHKQYAIYCRSGWRTGRMMDTMKQLWFTHVIELGGWIGAWAWKWKSFVKFDESKIINK